MTLLIGLDKGLELFMMPPTVQGTNRWKTMDCSKYVAAIGNCLSVFFIRFAEKDFFFKRNQVLAILKVQISHVMFVVLFLLFGNTVSNLILKY